MTGASPVLPHFCTSAVAFDALRNCLAVGSIGPPITRYLLSTCRRWVPETRGRRARGHSPACPVFATKSPAAPILDFAFRRPAAKPLPLSYISAKGGSNLVFSLSLASLLEAYPLLSTSPRLRTTLMLHLGVWFDGYSSTLGLAVGVGRRSQRERCGRRRCRKQCGPRGAQHDHLRRAGSLRRRVGRGYV